MQEAPGQQLHHYDAYRGGDSVPGCRNSPCSHYSATCAHQRIRGAARLLLRPQRYAAFH